MKIYTWNAIRPKSTQSGHNVTGQTLSSIIAAAARYAESVCSRRGWRAPQNQTVALASQGEMNKATRRDWFCNSLTHAEKWSSHFRANGNPTASWVGRCFALLANLTEKIFNLWHASELPNYGVIYAPSIGRVLINPDARKDTLPLELRAHVILAAINETYPNYLPEAAAVMELGHRRDVKSDTALSARLNAKGRLACLASVALALAMEGEDEPARELVTQSWCERYHIPIKLMQASRGLIQEPQRVLDAALAWPQHFETMAAAFCNTRAQLIRPFGYNDEYTSRAQSWAQVNQNKYGKSSTWSMHVLPPRPGARANNETMAREALRFGPSNSARVMLEEERRIAPYKSLEIDSLLQKIEAMTPMSGYLETEK